MSIVNRRNAVLGWATWKVDKRRAKKRRARRCPRSRSGGRTSRRSRRPGRPRSRARCSGGRGAGARAAGGRQRWRRRRRVAARARGADELGIRRRRADPVEAHLRRRRRLAAPRVDGHADGGGRARALPRRPRRRALSVHPLARVGPCRSRARWPRARLPRPRDATTSGRPATGARARRRERRTATSSRLYALDAEPELGPGDRRLSFDKARRRPRAGHRPADRHATSDEHPARRAVRPCAGRRRDRRLVGRSGRCETCSRASSSRTSATPRSSPRTAGELAGFLCGFLSQTYPEQAYVHFVGVSPEHRGAGLARELYERFFAAAREAGRTSVHCVTSPKNTGLDRVPPAHRLRDRGRGGGLRRLRTRAVCCLRRSALRCGPDAGSTMALPVPEARLRPSPRPLRVLDPRRGVPHPGARGAGRRARDARRHAHRPRLAGRRGRAPPRGARSTGSSRSSAARSTSPTTAAGRRRATRT